jgi:diguanylate cyclase (GGDEF)-like protein
MTEPEPVRAESDLTWASRALDAMCCALLRVSGARGVRLWQPGLTEGELRITVSVGDEPGEARVWRRGLGRGGSLGTVEAWPAGAAIGAGVGPLVEALSALLCGEALARPSEEGDHDRLVAETLRRLLEAGISAHSPLEAAAALAAAAAEALGFPVGCAYLVDASGQITDVVTVGAGPESTQRLRDCLVGREASPVWRRSMERPDLIDDTRVPGSVRPGGVAETMGFGSMAAIPLLSRDGPLGLVLCGDPRPRTQWRRGDRDLLTQLALQGTIVVDNARLRAAERRDATQDPLTGLANRALFLDRVGHALDRADRQAGPVGVMFVDIDDFKVVNDSLGHHLGDSVLIAVAERLKASTRPGDTVARLGGDEFAVLLESGQMPQAAETVAGRIATQLAEPIQIGTDDVSVRASIGIAVGQPSIHGPDALLRDADLAMYLAKRNGKGRFEMFQPAMHEQAVRRLETAADLRRGIEGHQLEVFYQPIIDTTTATTIGAEALVRWHHPTRGLVNPSEFIPVAESTGLIVALGQWVLAEACRQAQTWRHHHITNDTFYISVNLSARQLQDPTLIDDVTAALHHSGLPASALVLEVTESIIMADLDTAMARLHALKNLGLRLAIDDFGTGYSSLSYLRNFPMDIVKIDKSFVDHITIDTEGRAMVRGVIDLSSALGLTTIAEGVEHPNQLDLLRQLGCHSVQGFLFAQPMPSQDFAETLTQRHTDFLRLGPRPVAIL